MRRTLASKVVFLLALTVLPFSAVSALAEDSSEFYCEVLAVEGTVYLNNSEVYGQALKEGDLLKADDELQTLEGSTADLAFDKEWSNVTRIEEKTRMKIKAVFPTRLYIDQGALYAKLKSLPRDSTFQVETPTAIAAVRGTEYRTEYADGETSVSNDSEKETSQVYIYEPDDAGQLRGEPTLLPRTQFTGIKAGAKPHAPKPMTDFQKQHCQKARGFIDKRVQENVARGRVGKIQDIRKMENFGQKMKAREEARQQKEGMREERRKEERRREENRIAGPNDPSGGSGSGDKSDLHATDGRKMDWAARGREEGGSENNGGFAARAEDDRTVNDGRREAGNSEPSDRERFERMQRQFVEQRQEQNHEYNGLGVQSRANGEKAHFQGPGQAGGTNHEGPRAGGQGQGFQQQKRPNGNPGQVQARQNNQNQNPRNNQNRQAPANGGQRKK